MSFEFATANRIVFGPGKSCEITPHLRSLGRHAMVITGSNAGRARFLIDGLDDVKVGITQLEVKGEPTIHDVMAGAEHARQAGCDFIIGLGGGSVLDTGKAIAALITNRGDLLDYLEVIGRGNPLTEKPAPYVAMPTTAGTGTEVTRNAVIKSTEKHVKVSLRHALMLPDLAVIDPDLTHSMSPSITASTGLDAFTQLIEPFVSNKANPMVDGLCHEGMKRIARSLRTAYDDGHHNQAREDMALSSLFGGLALANAGLGAVHGIAGPMGGMLPIPHGVICGKLLPFVFDANVKALQARDIESPCLKRFDEVAQILTGNLKARAPDAVTWIRILCDHFSLPALSEYGLNKDAFPAIITKSQQASSMKGNPIALADEELEGILENVL